MTFRKAATAAVLAALALPAAAQAAQFQASADIFTGTGFAGRYVGPGGQVQPSAQWLGGVQGGGAGTFDNFGFYNRGVGALTQSRQVELLSGNLFRFLDTFTNTTGARIRTTVQFFGNLGSDGDELVSTKAGGLMVSCQDDGDGNCTEDAVIALVAGDNGLAQQGIAPDRYTVGFDLDVAAGQSVSLLNFAFLARDLDGPTADDVTLATETGRALLTAARVEGLTDAQRASIVNFSASALPEPASWVMMILGFGLAGGMLRRRRALVALAA